MLLLFKSVEQIKQKNTSYSKWIYKQVEWGAYIMFLSVRA